MFQKPSPKIALSQEEETEIEEPVNKSDTVETVVGPSVSVEGDFVSDGDIIVKGVVSGSVKTSRLLSVEEGAKIFANVKAGSAVISGTIKGNVKVVDTLELKSTAQVGGDIDCKVFIVEGGALIRGKVAMKDFNLESIKPDKKTSLGRPKTKVPKKNESM